MNISDSLYNVWDDPRSGLLIHQDINIDTLTEFQRDLLAFWRDTEKARLQQARDLLATSSSPGVAAWRLARGLVTADDYQDLTVAERAFRRAHCRYLIDLAQRGGVQ